MSKPRCITCGCAHPCACPDYERDAAVADAQRELERARETAKALLDEAREKRERDAFKNPILDAFDRLSRGDK